MTDATKLEPAFPGQWDHGQGQIESWAGMTIRDYFAAKAMHGIMAALNSGIRPSDIKMLASDAYLIADAMLKERAK